MLHIKVHTLFLIYIWQKLPARSLFLVAPDACRKSTQVLLLSKSVLFRTTTEISVRNVQTDYCNFKIWSFCFFNSNKCLTSQQMARRILQSCQKTHICLAYFPIHMLIYVIAHFSVASNLFSRTQNAWKCCTKRTGNIRIRKSKQYDVRKAEQR